MTVRSTLVFIRHHAVDDAYVFTHGSELPPDLLAQDQIDKLIDAHVLQEFPDRRSLYRLFPAFSGCSERQPLDEQELAAYALPPD